MFDWELKEYLKNTNYHLDHKQYLFICQTCPQLNDIIFDKDRNVFIAWSDKGEKFEFTVKYNEKLEENKK